MRAIFVLALCFAAVAAVPSNPQRIVGGSMTSIYNYPSTVALLYSPYLGIYWQACAGIILNKSAVLTAAHCPIDDSANKWRVRVGSNFPNSGGVVHNLQSILIHPRYNSQTLDTDIAIMRTATPISYTDTAQPAVIAGTNYYLADNQVLWAVGWGATTAGGSGSEQLRHVQIWTINQNICRSRYAELGYTITDNMLCSGWLDVGGRDQCQGDSGGPLYHNGNVVGVCSFGQSCALARYPGVNARVSRFTSWIQSNA